MIWQLKDVLIFRKWWLVFWIGLEGRDWIEAKVIQSDWRKKKKKQSHWRIRTINSNCICIKPGNMKCICTYWHITTWTSLCAGHICPEGQDCAGDSPAGDPPSPLQKSGRVDHCQQVTASGVWLTATLARHSYEEAREHGSRCWRHTDEYVGDVSMARWAAGMTCFPGSEWEGR